MARIDGVVLPAEKRIEYALPYLFGIGLKSARDILTKLKICLEVIEGRVIKKQNLNTLL